MSSSTAKTFEIPVKRLGPDIETILHLDQPRRDADAVMFPLHATLDDVGHVQFFRFLVVSFCP